jgi:signal transduction histidine kinase/CheY-like chemotaxis protein
MTQPAPARADLNAALNAVLITDELKARVSRQPDYEAENEALTALAAALAESPHTILQKLVEVACRLCHAGSAGVSLLSKDDGGRTFYWPAVTGALSPYVGGGTPRDFGPCGVVLDRGSMQLFARPERCFPYLEAIAPPLEEVLITPFCAGGAAVGTVWLVAHTPERRFDGEDLRVIRSLANFASTAYQLLETMDALTRDRQSLRAVDRRKDDFLAMLAHELRNPLAPIRSAADLLPKLDTSEQVGRIATIIARQTAQMARLIDDLLDVSRISRGTLTVQREPVDLRSISRQAAEAVQPQCDAAGIALVVSVPDDAVVVDADRARLGQVIVNLLNNAIKFTDAGGRVSLSIATDAGSAVISVRDEGIGIAPEHLERVFERFAQVDSSIERSKAGLGLGLTLVRTLAELHGGTVGVRSDGLGLGSEFSVRLPLPRRDGATATRSSGAVSVATPAAPRRLLVVDDNLDSAQMLAELLRTSGHDVHLAHDGPDAVRLTETLAPDIVLLDIGLPGMSGYDVARQIRASGARPPLLVALTGWGQPADRQRSKASGFDEHLLKPVDSAELARVIAAHGRRAHGASSNVGRPSA